MSSKEVPRSNGEMSGGNSSGDPVSFQSRIPQAVSAAPQPSENLTEHQLSGNDSITGELNLSSDQPFMASTPLMELDDGRNVSLTKMLMSADQFYSVDSIHTANDSRDDIDSSRVIDAKVIKSSEQVSSFKPPKKRSSSAKIIEKYSAPGAITDFVNPYHVGSASFDSEDEYYDCSEDEIRRERQSQQAINKTDGQNYESSNEAKSDDEEIHVCKRKSSSLMVKTTCEGGEDHKPEEQVTKSGSGVLKKLRFSLTETSKPQPLKNSSSGNSETSTSSLAVTSDTDSGSSLHRLSSLGEFKTASDLLHEKQRQQVKLKLMTSETKPKKKLAKKANSDSNSDSETSRTSLESAEVEVLSHFSGTNYSTPLEHLQKHVGRMKNSSEKLQWDERQRMLQCGPDGKDVKTNDVTNTPIYHHAICNSNENGQRRDEEGHRKDSVSGSSAPELPTTDGEQDLQDPQHSADSASLEEQDQSSPRQNGIEGQKTEEVDTSDRVVQANSLRKQQHQDTGASTASLPDYTTPSKLLKQHQESEGGQQRSPGYGAFEYTTPSEILKQQQQPGQTNMPSYTMPSELLKKYQENNGGRGRSPGYGAFEYTTPSELLNQRQQPSQDSRKRAHSMPDYATPSDLLKKHQQSERGRERSPGYGAFEYTTPSALLDQRQQPSRGNRERATSMPDYATPSELLRRLQENEGGRERSPGYEAFEYTAPSALLDQPQQPSRDSRGRALSMPDYTTPSELLRRRQENEGGRERSPGYGAFEYTTPSGLLARRQQSSQRASSLSGSSTPAEVPRRPQESPMYKETENPVDSRMEYGYSDKNLLDTVPSRLQAKHVQESTPSEITTYFRRVTEALDNASFPHSFSEPDFVRFCSSISGDQLSFLCANTDSTASVSDQKNPLASAPLNSSSEHEHLPFYSTNTSRVVSEDTGLGSFESFQDYATSLGYADSVHSPRDSVYNAASLQSSVQGTNTGNILSQTTQSSVSPKDVLWKILSTNPELDNQVLSPELVVAMYLLSEIPDPRKPSVTSQGSQLSQYGSVEELPGPPDERRASTSSRQGLTDKSKPTDAQNTKTTSTSGLPMAEKEKLVGHVRKLQVENSVLILENKMIKDKFNRAIARNGELEHKLAEFQTEMEYFQEQFSKEMTVVCEKARAEAQLDVDQLKTRVVSLTKQNESLQFEVKTLESKLQSSENLLDSYKKQAEKTNVISGYKEEVQSLKTELEHMKQLLVRSEGQAKEEMERAQEAQQLATKLTEVRNLLQEQLDTGGTATSVAEKQIQALQQRLRLTEERLHQERADRANTLSHVEEKLLLENAQLQSSGKDIARQLQREKDKTRNLDQKCRELKVENENLRLSIPLDDSYLISGNNYDVTDNRHSTHRQEEKVVADIKYIVSEVERETGYTAEQEEEIICHLWNSAESFKRRVQQMLLHLEELELDEDSVDKGLELRLQCGWASCLPALEYMLTGYEVRSIPCHQNIVWLLIILGMNLREMKGEYERKMKDAEEKMADIQSEKLIFENTYKEQLSVLMKEKHEAWARLKTLEDMMDAMQKENDTLRHSIKTSSTETHQEALTAKHEAKVESLTFRIQSLESETLQLQRNGEKLENEIKSLQSQLRAREHELEETKSELEMARSKTECTDDVDAQTQRRLDQVTAQVMSLQDEVRCLNDCLLNAREEKSRMEKQLENTRHLLQKTSTNTNMESATSKAELTRYESELQARECQILKVTTQFHEADVELKHVQQDLSLHQHQISDLETQVESLEEQLSQRGGILKSIRQREQEQLHQFQLVKDTLDAVTNSLSEKTAEMKVLQIQLQQEQSEREILERQLESHQELRDPDADVAAPKMGAVFQVQARDLKNQLQKLRAETLDSASLVQAKEKELSSLRTELTQTQEDLQREKSCLAQAASEKEELQLQLKSIIDERKFLLDEKLHSEEDLFKLEGKLQEVVHKFQIDASSKHSEPGSVDGKQMQAELKSLRLLLEGKEAVADAQNEKIERLHMEVGFLNRRVELLREVSQYHKEDIGHLHEEIAIKMKEKTVVSDLNGYLAREKRTIQQERQQLQRDLDREKDYIQRQKSEVTETIKKMEVTESSKQDTLQQLYQRDNFITNLEADLKQARLENSHQEASTQQLKMKIEQLKEDVHKLTSINSTLENRLEMEKASAAADKNNYLKKKEELMFTHNKLDSSQREQNMVLNNLTAERKLTEQLKADIDAHKTTQEQLREQIKSMEASLDQQRGQAVGYKETMENVKKEKACILKDYQDTCRTLGEKEKVIYELTGKCNQQVEQAHRETILQQSAFGQEKAMLEKDVACLREEISDLNEQLQQKDIQLKAFGRTLRELEDVTRDKKELEVIAEKLETTSIESKKLLDMNQTETSSLKESNSRLQEDMARLQVKSQSEGEKLRIENESKSTEILQLKQQITNIRNQMEGERSYLRDSLAQMESKVRSTEADLKSVTESRYQLEGEKKKLEKSLDEMNQQVSQETINRRMLEQKLESQLSYLENTKQRKLNSEEKIAELLAKITVQESERQMERERLMTLAGRNQELEASALGNQSVASAKQEQVELLQNEVGRLQQLLENQKQQLAGKFRKANLDLKQQLDSRHADRNKMAQEAQQLSVNLEQAREQIAIKNKENLQLQEEILCLEEKIRENSSKLKQAQDSLRMEEELQSQLNSRFNNQEEELRKLRTFLARKAEDSGDKEHKLMWQEMNRVIQDLSHQMQQHMEGQSGKEARDREIKLSNSYKRQINQLQSDLNTERALHNITKSSLASQESDCSKLRGQLYALRRKSFSPDKKEKSRSEEINEIIARSQSRAHAMLSSGNYLDGTLRNINPTRDYNINLNALDRSQSPDTASQLSDLSFNSTGAMCLAFISTSAQLPGSEAGTPRKAP